MCMRVEMKRRHSAQHEPAGYLKCEIHTFERLPFFCLRKRPFSRAFSFDGVYYIVRIGHKSTLNIHIYIYI